MKMKSLKAQFIAAIAMVLVAAVAVGTSTYAWFAANTTVTATDMAVQVKSDSTFLLIHAGEKTASEIQTAKKIVDYAVNDDATLLPVAHNALSSNYITSAETASNWYYKYSADPATSNVTVTAPTAVTDGNLIGNGKYVLANEFSLTVAAGGNQIDNLKVGTCTITTAGDAAVKVLVATATGMEEFDGAGGTGTNVLQTSLDSSSVMKVMVYIYWDGNDDDVFTNGIADLQNTTVELTFTGTAHTT